MVGQLIGQKVGRYRIDSLIGEGGMGSVLRGFDEMLQRDVAIKILSPQFVRRPNFRERFLQEARTAARLRHPGIVQVYDFGEAPSQLYIVMEFIPGDNLYELLKVLRNRGKQMIITEAIRLVRQVSLAIDYAHRNGVLHRDIKPSNIMLREGDDDGRDGLPYQPILTDLGLAKLAEGGVITTVGTSMGTPAYMSPEQALGDTTSPGSDVYSMGILLFELTTGQLPFPAKSITEAIRYHTKEPPPRPGSIRPELAGPIEQIILKALEKEPQDRYPDAATFADTLARLVSVPEQAQQAAESVSLFTLYEPSVVAQDKKRRSVESAVPERQDRLLIMMADQTTKTISLNPAGLSIGRGQDNDLMVDQPNVSRRHARIEHDGRNYLVVDLNSTNGTYLNDLKLLPDVPEVLTKDSTLRIGDTWMRLEPGPTSFSLGSATAFGFSSAVEAVSQTGEIGLKMQVSQLSVVPGQSAVVTFDILNQGRRVDHFHINVEGDHTDWVSDLPEPVYLMPGEQRTVSFNISPPRQAESLAGEHQLTINVTSKADPQQMATIQAVVVITPFQQFAAELFPKHATGIVEGKFQVRLRNGGNAGVQVGLEAMGQQDSCVFTFDQPEVNLPAGEESLVGLTVRSKLPIFEDIPRLHSFTVTARPKGTTESAQILHGQWEQRMPSFELELRPPRQSGISSGQFTILARSSTNDQMELRLEVEDSQGDCSYNVESTSMTLEPGQEDQVLLTVRPTTPLAGEMPRSHTFAVTARPVEAPSKSEQVTGEWQQVPPTFAIQLQPQRQSSSAKATYKVQISNQSQESLSIKLEATGAEGDCSFRFEPSRMTISRGQTQEASLIVQASRTTANTRAFAFTVTARPEEAPAVIRQAHGEWKQVPPQFEAELRPKWISSRSAAKYSLSVRNLSDGDLTIRPEATDAAGICHFTFEPSEFTVPAGTTRETGLTVRSAKGPKGKEHLNHSLTVTARVAQVSGITSRVEGSWEQLPGGRSMGAFVFLALIAWIIIIAGWTFALAYWPLLFDPLVFPLADSLGIDFFYVERFVWPLVMASAGAIGGLATGIAVKVAEPTASWKGALHYAIGWAISWAVGIGLMTFGLIIPNLGPVAAGALGGIFSGLLLRRTELPISARHFLLVVLGWFLGSLAIADGLGFVGPAIFGAVGGLFLLWQIGQARTEVA